jgi:hypothetical protein
MAEKSDITGQRFSRLLVLRYTENKTKANKRMVLCKCDCGNEKEMIASNLASGLSKSCGCLKVDSARERFTKHGYRNHPMYHRWAAMIQRCYDTNDAEYKNYGARGIKVCDRWRESFWNYAEDVGLPPFPGASIDRVVNDGDYCVGNCRWVSKKEQTLNRRNTRFLEFNGMSMCIADWERHLGFSIGSLKGRFARGMTVEQALSIPKSRRGIRLRKTNGLKF